MHLNDETRQKDVIQRGTFGSSPLGTTIFFLGRLADPYVQYQLLTQYGWGTALIKRLGGSTIYQWTPIITGTLLDRLELSPYALVLWLLSVGTMLKQIYHMVFIMQEKISPGFGLQFALGTGIGNSINSLLFVWVQTSACVGHAHNIYQTPLVVGIILYVIGMLLELVSEQQRCNWKKDPRNKGKVYRDGLFGVTRHINYFGYTTWRAGYALAAGGWIWALANFGLASYKSTQSIVPLHEQYMEEKYGDQYRQYQKTTRHQFMPWVY